MVESLLLPLKCLTGLLYHQLPLLRVLIPAVNYRVGDRLPKPLSLLVVELRPEHRVLGVGRDDLAFLSCLRRRLLARTQLCHTFSQKTPQTSNAGIGTGKIFTIMDGNRALGYLRLIVSRMSLRFLVRSLGRGLADKVDSFLPIANDRPDSRDPPGLSSASQWCVLRYRPSKTVRNSELR